MKSNVELLTIESVAEGFKNQDFKPSEIMEAFLENIKVQHKLNAYIDTYVDEALTKASEFDDLFKQGREDISLLSGIPISLKDIFLVKDKICTCGSKMLSDYVSNYDSTVKTRLQDKGAIILGKTAIKPKNTDAGNVILDKMLSIKSAVDFPGLTPGTNPPCFFILSATSTGLKAMAV